MADGFEQDASPTDWPISAAPTASRPATVQKAKYSTTHPGLLLSHRIMCGTA
jgi:hypothetical protein